MSDFYQILIYQGSDTVMPTGVMMFLSAQANHSGPITRDLLKGLPEGHVDAIVATLHSQMANLQAPESDSVEANLQQVEQAFQLVDSLLLLSNFKDKLSGEEYIRMLCEACRKFMAHPVVVNKILNALGRLMRKSAATVHIAFKYEFHLILGEVAKHHTEHLPADGSSSRDEFLTFLSGADKASGTGSLRNTLGGGGARSSMMSSATSMTGDLGGDSEVEESPFMPAMSLCGLLLTLWQLMLTHNDDVIVATLSEHCFPSVLTIGSSFLPSTFMVTRHLLVISRFASHQQCLETVVTRATVSHLITLIAFHLGDISLISSALVLFSDFSAIEREDDEAEEDRFSAATVILESGGFDLVNKVIHAHMNRPVVLTLCMEVVFNLVEPDSAHCFSHQSEALVSFFENVFVTLNRYDFDHSLVLSALQACVQFTSSGVGADKVFGGETSGRSRMSMLIEMMQDVAEEKASLSVQEDEDEGAEREDAEGAGGDSDTLSTQDSIVSTTLELINSTLVLPETVQLLFPAGGVKEGADNEAVRVVLLILSTYSRVPALVKECLSFLLTVANADDNLSRNVGEKGSLLFINMVEPHIEDSTIVSLIFQLFGRLVFIKKNLMSFVQHKGIGLLLTAMKVIEDDAELITSAVTTLGNIVSSDEECSNLVLEAGTEKAVEAVQTRPSFQPASEFQEVHSAARSTLLAISARLRAKERIGTKTNVGTLLSRIGQDVNDVVNSDKDKVKESSLDLHMADPLLPVYRSALKSGQNVTDYVKGSTFARKLWLTSDCGFLILKEDTNNIKKLGRKIKLQHIVAVQRGYGPGHYKSGFLGGKKTKAVENNSLYLSVSDKAPAEDAITIEFANASDCNKWFDVFTALLTASLSCPHFLQEL